MVQARYRPGGIGRDGLPPDVFIIEVVRDDYHDSMRVLIRSRMYDFQMGYHIRHRWGDITPLVHYIRDLIGGTLKIWYDAAIPPQAGHHAARGQMDLWERAIHRRMEELERHYRNYERGPRDYIMGDEFRFRYTGEPETTVRPSTKARELLLSQLNEEQKQDYVTNQRFSVKAKDGQVYVISRAQSFNVRGPDGTRYCGQLEDVPLEDQMLAQKLLLEHNPDKFFKNANRADGPGIFDDPYLRDRHGRFRW